MRRRRAREGQEKRETESRRPILKKLCAALLQSFRGQHSEKKKGSAQGNWDHREGQQPFRPNPKAAEDRTTTMGRLLIGAVGNKLGIVVLFVIFQERLDNISKTYPSILFNST